MPPGFARDASTMAATEQHFPNRGPTAIGVHIFVTVLTVLIAIWRLIVRFRINPRLGWSDYMIICALPMALAGHTFAILSAQAGEGRLDADPFLTPDQAVEARLYMFFQRVFNLYAMLFAKLSITAYLLALNFSKGYRITIWISLGFIAVCVGFIPFWGHWAQCKPLKSRWDSRVKGHCLGGNQFKFASMYMQLIVNVATDLLFAAAPILYLRRVKLSKYTRIGVQGVFLCSILGTGISVAKLYEFRRSYGAKNELYKSTTSTILSVCENSTCIIVACLPPLRKNFDDFLKKILPERFLSAIGASNQRSQTHALPSYYGNTKRSRNGTTMDPTEDNDSDMAILPEDDYIEDADGRIRKAPKAVVKPGSASSGQFGHDGQKPL